MTTMEIRRKLAGLLDSEFGIFLDGVDPDLPIFEQVPVDSMALVAIAAKVEQEFGIELPLNFMEAPTLNHLFGAIEHATRAG